MRRVTWFLFAALLSPCLCGTLLADLAWEQKTLSFRPAVADTEVTARFKFQNTGTAVVTIKSVVAACGCTTATASKQSYAPGDKGEIVAKFAIEDRTGAQTEEINVESVDSEKPLATLTMEVAVPKIAELEPDFLRWVPGDSLEPKRFRVTAVNGVTLKLIAVKSSDPGVSAQIEPSAQPGSFEVVVTPRDDCTAFSGSLYLETDFPKKHPKTLLAHVQVAR